MRAILNNHHIQTSLYWKPTDSHDYLLFSSAHPRHCLTSTPYSQFLRIRRICSDEDDFILKSIAIGKHFIRRGYPIQPVGEAIIRALRTDRMSLLAPTTPIVRPPDTNKMFLISNYTPGFNAIQAIVSKNLPMLARSSATRQLLDHTVIYGHRRPPNLRDILVRAKVTTQTTPLNPPVGVNNTHSGAKRKRGNTCNTRSCRYCPRMNRSGTVSSTTTGRIYSSKTKVCCKSSNLIYCITCKHCHMQYVGQTKRRLMDRFQGHFYNVTSKNTNDTVGRHFTAPDHHGLDDFSISIVDFIFANPKSAQSQELRNLIELKWIHRLRTTAPLGLNVMD